jgi:hypothetical protein
MYCCQMFLQPICPPAVVLIVDVNKRLIGLSFPRQCASANRKPFSSTQIVYCAMTIQAAKMRSLIQTQKSSLRTALGSRQLNKDALLYTGWPSSAVVLTTRTSYIDRPTLEHIRCSILQGCRAVMNTASESLSGRVFFVEHYGMIFTRASSLLRDIPDEPNLTHTKYIVKWLMSVQKSGIIWLSSFARCLWSGRALRSFISFRYLC